MQKEIKEKYNKALGVKYVSAKGCFILETGVRLDYSEIQGLSKEEIKEVYNRELSSGISYDYIYTRTTGFVRKKRGITSPKTQITPVQTPIETPKQKEGLMKGGSKSPYAVMAFRVILLIIGVVAVTMSVYYTGEFLSMQLNKYLAYALSAVMVMFLSVSLEISMLFFEMKGFKVLSVLFIFLWFSVTAFSMVSTMAVNYNNYNLVVIEAEESSKDERSAEGEIQVLERRIVNKEKEINLKENEIHKYMEREEYSAWYLGELQKGLSKMNTDLDGMYVSVQTLTAKNPDVFVEKKAKEKNFYTLIESIFGFPAEVVQFVLNTIPALFIDIVAPFSIAASISLSSK